jgi:hypothetical protein
MKKFHTLFAIALSLIIGLSSMTAVSHSHSDHEDSSCSVSVLQKFSAVVAAETSRDYVTRVTSPNLIYVEKTASNRVRGCQLARAPPQIL